MIHVRKYLDETATIAAMINDLQVEKMAEELAALRERGGRLFILGLGGSAANASHAVNDFRKLTGIEAYTPADNVAELTAIANDEGLEWIFLRWLEGSKFCEKDALLVLSVGGGTEWVSRPLKLALDAAHYNIGAKILGIVGRDGGLTAQRAERDGCCVIVPTVNEKHVTPHTEAFQAVILHALVSHPALQQKATKW